MLISARFGFVDGENRLQETEFIRFAVGTSYGYELEVLASEEAFEVYDYLFIPHASGEASTNETISNPSQAQQLADYMPEWALTGRKAFDCAHCIRYGRAFRIAKSDPDGLYRLVLFVGEHKAGDWHFSLDRNQEGEQSRAGNSATRRT